MTRHFDFALTRPKPRTYTRAVVDLETFLITPLVQAPPVVAMGFCLDGGRKHVVAANDPAFDRVVEALFLDPSIRVVGHNFRFDLACLLAHGAKFGLEEWPGMLLGACHDDRVTDTMLREQLYRVAQAALPMAAYRFDLGAVADRWETPTRPDKTDPWRQKWGSLANLHARDYPADAVRYLHDDLAATDEVFLAQEAKASWMVDQYARFRASVSLYLTQCWGFRTDPEAAAKLYAETEADLAAATAICQAEGLVRPSGTRNKKAAEERLIQVFRARGESAPRGKATEKMIEKNEDALGNVKLDEEACLRSRDPVLEAYTKVSQATTLLSKVGRLRHPVIQASFNALVATGRTSCRQGDDPKPGEVPNAHGFQTQNPPRTGDLRAVFVARPGRLLSSVDYDSFEMSSWAQCCLDLVGSSNLAAILADPARDMHVEMAAQIHGIPAAELYALKHSDPKKYKDLRQIGKPANFGLPGGLGAARFVDFAWAGYGIVITEAQAREIKKKWMELYPEAKPYFELIAERVREGRGKWRIKQLRSGRVRGGCTFPEACNGFFQSLAADAALEAGWRLTVHMYACPESPLYGSRPVNFLHDEWQLELPETSAAEAAELQARIQVEAAKEYMPDVRVSASPALMRRWYKNADPVYRDGELVPWEPKQ